MEYNIFFILHLINSCYFCVISKFILYFLSSELLNFPINSREEEEEEEEEMRAVRRED